jgi:hypothetical protein
MSEPCHWQDKRGNDCARPAAWSVGELNEFDSIVRSVHSCNVHLGDIVRERAVEWVGCWVDKA